MSVNQWIAENWGVFPIVFTVGALILLGWIAHFLYTVVFYESVVPYQRSPQDILDYSETEHLASILRILSKISLLDGSNWPRVVKIALEFENKEDEIDALYKKEEELNTKKGKLKAEIEAKTENLPKKPIRPPFEPPHHAKHRLEIFLPVGLSFFLFLGISEFLGIDVQALDLSLTLVLGVAGAICINLAEYRFIYTMVLVTYPYARQQLNSTSHWKRLLNDPKFSLTVIIIICETCFAAPGLLKLFLRSERQNPRIMLIVYVGCALAALVNVGMAWWEAKRSVEHQFQVKEARESYEVKEEAYFSSPQYEEDLCTIQERKEKLEEIALLKSELGEVSANLASVRQQIQRLERRISKLSEEALQEYRKWSRSARFWLLFKCKEVKELQATDTHSFNYHTNNGKGSKPSELTYSEGKQP